MTVMSFIPESAPFNAEQRAWLNGFLAGWIGVQEVPGTAATVATAAVPEPAVEEAPWHDPALPLDDRMAMAEGRPLADRLMASMAQLDCGACGYVCRTYADALAGGEEARPSLCSPGGTETARRVKALLKSRSSTSTPAATAPPASSPQNHVDAPLIRSVKLNGEGSEKETRHVEIDLSGTALEYKVGDALGVYPTNCDNLVNDVLDALQASGDEPVGEWSLREALTRSRCLADLGEPLLELLAASVIDLGEASTLRGWIDGDGAPAGCDVLDALREFPSARPDLAAFVAALSPLRPRLYSISSSPRKHAGQVHLTVGRVATIHGGRVRKGVASTMLAERVASGDPLRVFVQPSHGFTLPADPTTPMIMIGPGTGIAPFRAFLHERDAIGATGKNWLIFGDQREASDFLYRDELVDLAAQGVLTRLDTAFSRDGDRKVYVQHRLQENGCEVYRWLQDGAALYVCGDARRMAVDVDHALRQIAIDHGGMSEAQARIYLADLARAGRYCRDVY